MKQWQPSIAFGESDVELSSDDEEDDDDDDDDATTSSQIYDINNDNIAKNIQKTQINNDLIELKQVNFKNF